MKYRQLFLIIGLAVALAVAGCKKEAAPPANANAPEKRATAQAPSFLPQPADITSSVAQFDWNWTREDTARVTEKLGLRTHRFKMRFIEWEGKFEGYPGRILLEFDKFKPLRQVQLFIFAPEGAGNKEQVRKQMFEFWDKKLAQRYGGDFKTEEMARAKSHIWQLRPDFRVELRVVTATDTDPQLGIYWQLGNVEKLSEQDEEEKSAAPSPAAKQ
jgi:hypothetical protein